MNDYKALKKKTDAISNARVAIELKKARAAELRAKRAAEKIAKEAEEAAVRVQVAIERATNVARVEAKKAH